MKNQHWPIRTLLILAPATGELLSGSAPPAEFFNPFTFWRIKINGRIVTNP